MGFLKNGPFSGFTGRTGSLVGYRKKNKWVMAAVRATEPKPPTPLQLENNMKFGMMASWLSWLNEFIKFGFQDYTAKMSAQNAAMQYNLDRAVTGVAPNFTIDYPQVLFSRGKLAQAYQWTVSSATEGQLDFSWLPNIGTWRGAATDLATFIAYNPVKDQFVIASGVAARSSLSYEMALPIEFSGDSVQLWMAFVSANKKEVSTSDYLGEIIVT
jgi:hypothetical protein